MLMPILEAEIATKATTAPIIKINPFEVDHDQCTPAIPELEIQEKVRAKPKLAAITAAEQSSSSSSRRKCRPLFSTDSDLEDEDLQFRGYCYTMVGDDGEKSLNETYACPYCPAIFDSRVGLTNHAKLHGAEKKMKCEFCDFACTNKKTMRVHRRIHGIILKRGRQPGTWPKPKKIKTEEEEAEIDANKMKNNIKEEKFAENAQHKLKMGNLCPTAGAVQIEDVRKGEEKPAKKETIGETKNEERIVIVSNNKIGVRGGGLEEEEPDSAVNEETPKKAKKQIGRKKKQQQEKQNQSQITESGAGTSSTAPNQDDKYALACTICPYRTTQPNYLDQHMFGHTRTSGYACSVCGFKHEHKRWLNSHCAVHQEKQGLHYEWPPEYVYGEETVNNDEEEEGKQQKMGGSPNRRR